MRVLRIHIRGWTASFRNPLFVSGFQPTLPIPPLSTLYGLLSAAKGDWVLPNDAAIGFVFISSGKAKDLETIYEFDESRLKAKSNICIREFLIDPELYIYSPALWLRPYLERPHYPILLGRSTELATIESIADIELVQSSTVIYKNTLLPFPMDQIYGPIQSLPTHFTQERPRKPQGIKAFYLITHEIRYSGMAWYDQEKNWGVYLHGQH